ncbi:unnamed protein product [Sphenostylis stenocarpa]|uniref:Uncharacterized protein n=1 Tax=Sphenostylis stenocarpa TaxID=92480 RepID=A0AA87BBC1_9FABA|nr:unnamed protein product [Sphenostylis stenocarpa]
MDSGKAFFQTPVINSDNLRRRVASSNSFGCMRENVPIYIGTAVRGQEVIEYAPSTFSTHKFALRMTLLLTIMEVKTVKILKLTPEESLMEHCRREAFGVAPRPDSVTHVS